MNDGLLLDTNVLIWTLAGNSKVVSARAKRSLLGPDAALTVSIVSAWEIVLKHQAGKLDLATGVDQVLNDVMDNLPWTIFPVLPAHVRALARLPTHHKDPFDRLLTGPARSKG